MDKKSVTWYGLVMVGLKKHSALQVLVRTRMRDGMGKHGAFIESTTTFNMINYPVSNILRERDGDWEDNLDVH